MILKIEPFKYSRSIWIALIISWFYWIYVFFTTEMVVIFDAIGYEHLARVILNDGWAEFFRIGPNREPFYPWMISIAMALADTFHVPYASVVKIFQMLILGVTQISLIYVFRLARVRDVFVAGSILYFAFSPAIVNVGFSLFSEIAVLPFMIGIVVAASFVWTRVTSPESTWKTFACLGLLFSSLFFVATTVKGIFEYIFWVFILINICMAVWFLIRRRDIAFQRMVLFTAASLMIMVPGVHVYKSLNLKYNGNYAFTNRALALLYGNTMKRTNDLSSRQIMAHVANIPGNGFCQKIFSYDECRYAEFVQADVYRLTRTGDLREGPQHEQDERLKAIVIERLKRKPAQYFLLMGIESLRIFFWESTRIGFVNYPDWLWALYTADWFSDGIRAVVSLLTMLSFLAAVWFVVVSAWKNRKGNGCWREADVFQEWVLIAICVLMISTYTGLYSLFSIVARYAIVLAPLYIFLIGWCIERVIQRKERKHT